MTQTVSRRNQHKFSKNQGCRKDSSKTIKCIVIDDFSKYAGITGKQNWTGKNEEALSTEVQTAVATLEEVKENSR